MFNNEVTYDNKWDTPEARAASAKLDSKYFDKSSCSPDCPLSWAVDVLELFETLDRELGFQYNEGTIRGYYVQGNALDWFVTGPWKGLFSSFNSNFIEKKNKRDLKFVPGTQRRYWQDKTFLSRCNSVICAFTHSFKYGFKATKVRYINPILNKIFKNKISLGQLKEKYGSLCVYFSAPDAYDQFINNEIYKCELRLAMRGCYLPIESLWDATTSHHVGDEYHPDTVEIEHGEYNGEKYTSVKRTMYRKVMKDLGFDLKEIEAKAKIRKAIKDSTNV